MSDNNIYAEFSNIPKDILDILLYNVPLAETRNIICKLYKSCLKTWNPEYLHESISNIISSTELVVEMLRTTSGCDKIIDLVNCVNLGSAMVNINQLLVMIKDISKCDDEEKATVSATKSGVLMSIASEGLVTRLLQVFDVTPVQYQHYSMCCSGWGACSRAAPCHYYDDVDCYNSEYSEECMEYTEENNGPIVQEIDDDSDIDAISMENTSDADGVNVKPTEDMFPPISGKTAVNVQKLLTDAVNNTDTYLKAADYVTDKVTGSEVKQTTNTWAKIASGVSSVSLLSTSGSLTTSATTSTLSSESISSISTISCTIGKKPAFTLTSDRMDALYEEGITGRSSFRRLLYGKKMHGDTFIQHGLLTEKKAVAMVNGVSRIPVDVVHQKDAPIGWTWAYTSENSIVYFLDIKPCNSNSYTDTNGHEMSYCHEFTGGEWKHYKYVKSLGGYIETDLEEIKDNFPPKITSKRRDRKERKPRREFRKSHSSTTSNLF